ncbi:hypothetical protein NDU88_005863 [Pleurodeles waltl]|uniref:Uncharacterized protein n=1 Tax=Pleurodeles waltl TaxID=8319 RepID=A0AAV7TDF9_PLEWA|nr:hypothetical protein NDU88_005863 [Pleurodeles waltl]
MLTTPTVPHTNQSARGQRVSCHPGDLRAAKVKAGSLNSLTVQSGADKSDVGLENILTHKQDRKYRRKFGLTGGKLAIVGWFFTPLESNPASDRRASGGRDETRYQVGSSPLWSQILLRTGVPLEEERKLDISVMRCERFFLPSDGTLLHIFRALSLPLALQRFTDFSGCGRHFSLI